MKILIDADILVYRAGFACERKVDGVLHVEPVENAYSNMRNMLHKILWNLNSDNYICYLTASNDETNFRKILFPEYKANRKKYKRPDHYEALRLYLSENYNTMIISGVEADDALAIEQYESLEDSSLKGSGTIIASIDKDLDIVPGWHYNFVKDLKYYQYPLDGLKCFYKQLLIGDAVDNIPSIKKGYRRKHSFAAIDKAETEAQMFDIVWAEYDKQGYNEEEAWKHMNWKAKLLFPLKTYDFEFKFELDKEVKL